MIQSRPNETVSPPLAMDLSVLFPPQVVILKATNEMWTTPLCSEEERLIEGSVAKRQREFRAGRNAAHAALKQLNAPSGPLLRDENRQPVWPRGYLGSISHCEDSCVAACVSAEDLPSLGIDVEPLKPLSPGVARYIDTDQERVFMERHPELPRRLIFSAKESLYKCYHPLIKRFFGFHSVSLDIDTSNGRFNFEPTDVCKVEFPQDLDFHGRYLVTEHHLYTSCFLTTLGSVSY
ncbi:MAG: 4'-phosphopantetheinyl transferase superfamily protein [Candidatus Thiodiazotropha sp.]